MKPRIVHVLDAFNGGGLEIGIANLIRRGFYDGVDLSVLGLIRGNGGSYGPIVDLIGKANARFVIDAPAFPKFASPRLACELFATFRRLAPDAVVLSSTRSNVLGRAVASFFPRINLAAFEHSIHARKGLTRLKYRLTSLRCDMVWGDDPQTLEAMRYLYWGAKPEYYVPLVMLEPGAPRRAQPVPSRFNLLSIGRLEAQKNYLELVRGVAALAAQGYDLTLTIAGSGIQQQELQALAQALNVAGRIRLLGYVSDPAVLARLREEAHIYVQPSVMEGFCLAAAEALAAGMPVVAADVGGLRSYGADNVNMLKIKGFAAADIAARLRDAMDDYGRLAEPLSRAAIETARKEFAESAVRARWAQARQALIAGRP